MKQVKEIIREIVPVIIGILIALFINNWNDERKEKKYLDKIFSSIEKELEESVLDIKKVIPKQRASLDTLQAYLNNDSVSLYDIMMKSGGVFSPVIKMNSWKAFANSKIELIEYEKLTALADIEERKNNLKMRSEKKLDFIFKNFEATSKQKKVILHMMILDIINFEKSFQSKIEKLIKK